MRDSRVGTFGAPALVLVTLGKVGALQSIGGTDAFIGLIAADALGRTTALVLMLTLPRARSASLGAAYTARLPRRLVTVVVVVFVAAAASSGVAGLAALGAVFGVVVLTAAVAHRRFGGLTGDVLGAAEQLSELAVLLVLSQLSDAATWF